MANVSYSDIRGVALNLRSRALELFDQLSPILSASQVWTLDGDDSLLPALSELKTLAIAYDRIRKADLALRGEIMAVKTADVATVPIGDLPSLGFISEAIFEAEHAADGAHDKADLNYLSETQAAALTGGAMTALHTHDYNKYVLETHGDAYHAADVPRFAFVQWVGNGVAGHVITFSPAFVPRVVVRMQSGTALGVWFCSSESFMHFVSDAYPHNYTAVNNISAVGSGTLTLAAGGSFNGSGLLYEALIF